MRIISFGWTAPAFMAGAKDTTRRDWKAEWAKKFKVGDQCEAWSSAPYAKGIRLGIIRLTVTPFLEGMPEMSNDEYEREGFDWFNKNQSLIPKSAQGKAWAKGGCSFEAFKEWRSAGGYIWVVRFETVAIYDSGKEWWKKYQERVLANAR